MLLYLKEQIKMVVNNMNKYIINNTALCDCLLKESTDNTCYPDHIWLRPVTTREHGIYKPYKGVYKCTGCGTERILDNQEAILENNENIL